MTERTTEDVFEQHLKLRVKGHIEQDLEMNYAQDVTLLCEFGALHGRDAIRESAQRLGLQLPDATFEFPAKRVEGDYAFLVWNANAANAKVYEGVDTFVIRGGRVVMQSIHYRLRERGEPRK